MTNYGVRVDDDGDLNENEKAMLYIKECAESVGIEVIDGKTAFSIPFMAEVMRRLRGEVRKYEYTFSDYPDMPYQFDNMTGSMNL